MNPALLFLILAGLANQVDNRRGSSSGFLSGLSSGSSSGFLSSLSSGLSSNSLPSLIPPNYFDTFKMELLLDKLHETVDALERVNRLNQIVREPLSKQNSAQHIKESVDAVKPFLPNQNQAQLSNIASAIDGLKQFGDMQGIMQAMGPVLKMLSAPQNTDNSDNQ